MSVAGLIFPGVVVRFLHPRCWPGPASPTRRCGVESWSLARRNSCQNVFLPPIVNLLLEVHALPLHLLLHDLLEGTLAAGTVISKAFEAILVGPRPAVRLILPHHTVRPRYGSREQRGQSSPGSSSGHRFLAWGALSLKASPCVRAWSGMMPMFPPSFLSPNINNNNK